MSEMQQTREKHESGISNFKLEYLIFNGLLPKSNLTGCCPNQIQIALLGSDEIDEL
jgi:hypothetical protein